MGLAPAVLKKEMGEVIVGSLIITLPPNLSPADEAKSIRYRVSGRDQSVGPVSVPIDQLARR